MKGLHIVSFILLVIGGLNWLLVGAFGFDLVAFIFGDMSIISNIIYVIVGIAAIFELLIHKSICKMCSSNKMM